MNFVCNLFELTAIFQNQLEVSIFGSSHFYRLLIAPLNATIFRYQQVLGNNSICLQI